MNKALIIGKLVLVTLVAMSALSLSGGRLSASGSTVLPAATTGANLLANGNFDSAGYYFRPSNHFVAGKWYEWWAGSNVPEFIDGGSIYHNQCYPVPTNASGLCKDDKNHSQGYIRWGGPYIAGVYQPVSVMACTYYRLEAYNRNDGSNYHPKIGIEPTGWTLPMPSGQPIEPINCPPDGFSVCPDPHLDSVAAFPATMVWSPEFDHDARTWASQSLVTEAFSNTISVWLYVAPDESGGPSRSTYWDYASLVQVSRPNGKLIDDGTLPAADGSVTNVTTQTTALRAYLTWKTSQPALTQVLYHYVGDANMTSPPPPAKLTSAYEFSTTINYNLGTDHWVRLPSLRPTSLYDYAILSRKPVGNSCQTSVFVGRLSTGDNLVAPGPLPTPSNDIIGATVLPLENSAYVIWQSSQPSFAQVLYNYNGPITPTIYPTMTQQVFLPAVALYQASDSTYNYALHTAPITTSTTLHIIKLPNLQTNGLYVAVAVSAWSQGDQDKVAVSARLPFRTGATSASAVDLPMDQLAERLQTCLASGKQLEACVSELSK